MEKTDTKQLQKGRKNSEHILPFCIPKKIKIVTIGKVYWISVMQETTE